MACCTHAGRRQWGTVGRAKPERRSTTRHERPSGARRAKGANLHARRDHLYKLLTVRRTVYRAGFPAAAVLALVGPLWGRAPVARDKLDEIMIFGGCLDTIGLPQHTVVGKDAAATAGKGVVRGGERRCGRGKMRPRRRQRQRSPIEASEPFDEQKRRGRLGYRHRRTIQRVPLVVEMVMARRDRRDRHRVKVVQCRMKVWMLMAGVVGRIRGEGCGKVVRASGRGIGQRTFWGHYSGGGQPIG